MGMRGMEWACCEAIFVRSFMTTEDEVKHARSITGLCFPGRGFVLSVLSLSFDLLFCYLYYRKALVELFI